MLEDTFLKKNIPGRYSSWTNDGNDNSPRQNDTPSNDVDDSDEDSEDDEYYFKDLPTIKPSSATAKPQSSRSIAATGDISRNRTSSNTGVKGVISDYNRALLEEQLQLAEDRLERMEILQKATYPAVNNNSASTQQSCIKSNNNERDDDDNDDLDNSVDDNDDFLQSYRSQRLKQLQTETSTLLPTFSTFTSTTPEEYVSLVDSIDSRVYLIVHLYEPTIKECAMLHSTLEKVAACMNYAKFIEVEALQANPDLDTICLPALLVYRGGELVHNLVRFTDELVTSGGGSDVIGVEEVMDALESLGIVDPRHRS